MSGLDRILQQIRSDSEQAVEKIKAEAEKTVLENRAETSSQTESEIERIKQQTKSDCAEIIKRAQSSAELIKKQSLLRAKQKAIAEMISSAHSELLSLPVNEYFELIEKLISIYAHNGEKGVIAFNERDIQRMPKLYKAKIALLSQGNLKFADSCANIDGGFVLIYGGIEENCSFEAIFREKHDALVDEVSSMLFS